MSRVRVLSLLLLTAALWGFAFVPQRQAMQYLGPLMYTGIRFGLGALIVFAIFHKEILREISVRPKQHLFGGILMGSVLTLAVCFQQWGLLWTTAGKAGFLTGAYVTLVPVIGLVLHQRPTYFEWLGVVLALAGAYLLADPGDLHINFGDVLVGICAIFWAIHVQVVGSTGRTASSISLAFVQFVTCGVAASLLGLILESTSLSNVVNCWWPLLYGGAVSVGIAYTIQVFAQKYAEPTPAAIILSLESVFAALLGWFVLHEQFSQQGLLGCALLLIATIVSQVKGKGSAA